MTIFQAPATIKKEVHDFLGAGQSDAGVQRVFAKVSPLLASGEQVEHLLIQTAAALKIFPGAVALTNRRAILLEQGMLKMSFRDVFWRDLADAHLVEGLMGSTLGFQSMDGVVVSMEHLPKQPTRPAYAYAQQIEELALEYRRTREMEEARAAARGVPIERFLDVPPAPAGPPSIAPGLSPAAALAELNSMKEANLLTPDEYDRKKADILTRL